MPSKLILFCIFITIEVKMNDEKYTKQFSFTEKILKTYTIILIHKITKQICVTILKSQTFI